MTGTGQHGVRVGSFASNGIGAIAWARRHGSCKSLPGEIHSGCLRSPLPSVFSLVFPALRMESPGWRAPGEPAHPSTLSAQARQARQAKPVARVPLRPVEFGEEDRKRGPTPCSRPPTADATVRVSARMRRPPAIGSMHVRFFAFANLQLSSAHSRSRSPAATRKLHVLREHSKKNKVFLTDARRLRPADRTFDSVRQQAPGRGQPRHTSRKPETGEQWLCNQLNRTMY